MQTVNNIIKTSSVEGKNRKQELYRFLATSNCTTGVAPATLLFSREIKAKLPHVGQFENDDQLRTRDREKKDAMKRYADNKRYVKSSALTPGDTVLVTPAVVRSKLQTTFDKLQLIVTGKRLNDHCRDGRKTNHS